MLEGWAFNIDNLLTRTFQDFNPATGVDFAGTYSLPGGTAVVSFPGNTFDAGSIATGPSQSVVPSGVGTVQVRISGAGPHTVTLWFDESLTGSDAYLLENGVAVGGAPGGTEWGIDDPGYAGGTLYTDVLSNQTLSQTGAVWDRAATFRRRSA